MIICIDGCQCWCTVSSLQNQATHYDEQCDPNENRATPKCERNTLCEYSIPKKNPKFIWKMLDYYLLNSFHLFESFFEADAWLRQSKSSTIFFSPCKDVDDAKSLSILAATFTPLSLFDLADFG